MGNTEWQIRPMSPTPAVGTDQPCLVDGAGKGQAGCHIGFDLSCLPRGCTVGDRQMRDRVGDQASIRGRVWPALEHLGGQTAKRVIGLWDKKENLREPAAAREGHGEAGMTSDQPAHLTQPVLVEVLLRQEGINDRDVGRDARSRGRIELPAPAPNDGLGSTNGNDDRSLSGSETP